jgi:hypothetical protein
MLCLEKGCFYLPCFKGISANIFEPFEKSLSPSPTRLGAEDAPLLAKEFQPKFEVQDLVNLPNHAVYLKLMIDGTPSKPFSAEAIRMSG